ncbi:MAG: ATP-binding protein [Proteobacteria bacterium]|nr:ATP-binding protein [Pseudomonadota bacterium]
MAISTDTMGDSTGYPSSPLRRAGADAAKLLAVYNAYRALVALSLLALGLIELSGISTIPGYNTDLLWLSGLWSLTALALFRRTEWLASRPELGPLAIMLFDLVMVAFLTALGSELGSGLPLLFLPTVSASAVVIRNRLLATAVAALATLAVLSDSTYQLQQGAIDSSAMLSAGLLSTLIFLISLLLQLIVGRMDKFEQLADSATTQVATLEELNDQVIAHMTVGVCRISPDNRLTAVNKAAMLLLELTDFETPVSLETVDKTLAQYVSNWRSGQHTSAMPFKIHSEGKLLMPKLISVGHDFEPEILLFVEDYTPVTEAAQTLKLNALGKLTASIAHEIRNPLTAISHASQLMEDISDNPAEQIELCRIISNNTQRVNEIIENILQLSRREDAKRESLDLLAWLRLFIPEYEQGQAHGSCVTLRAPEPVGTILFDPGHLRRILTNLLDNGVRHAGERTGQFTVTLELTKDIATNKAHIDVIDAGSGVPDTMRDRLFEPFFTTSPKGSGLGLYLCRELCQSNNAALSYDRTVDDGTRFRVAIPLEGRAP